MRREWRLRQTRDFDRARASGRSWANATLVCYVFDRGDTGPARIGITVGKRSGNAVVRNRIKRRLRELIREHHPAISPGADLVLIARTPAALASLDALGHDLSNLLRRAGVLALDVGGDVGRRGQAPPLLDAGGVDAPLSDVVRPRPAL